MYQTPEAEDIEAEEVCYLLRFPGSAAIKGLVNGALASLVFENAWEQDGSLLPADTAQVFKQMLLNAEYRCMIGSIIPFAGSGVPSWALLCDGSEYDASLYPKLFAALDDAFKTVDSFVTPNLINRTVIGSKTSEEGDFVFANEGGEVEHTISVSEMPYHSHTNAPHSHTDLGHTHVYSPPGISLPVVAPGEAPVQAVNLLPGITGTGFAELTFDSIDIDSTGESEPHNNMPPYLALKWIIVAK